MKEKIFLIGAIAVLVVLLVLLNAASYVQREEVPDSEAFPNRSTYSTGPTGTRAFHDLIASGGRKVVRWEKPIGALSRDQNGIQTFVIVGTPRREIEEVEIEQLLEWVSFGRRLVIIDRDPPEELLKTSASWKIRTTSSEGEFSENELALLLPTVDPSNSAQMTDGETASKPYQPTVLTAGVSAVQTSKFATSIELTRTKVEVDEPRVGVGSGSGPGAGAVEGPPAVAPVEDFPDEESLSESSNSAENLVVETENGEFGNSAEPPITVSQDDEESGDQDIEVVETTNDFTDYSKAGPLVHMGNERKEILVEFPYRAGSITLLTDPYIISNNGIKLVDNSQLGLNIASRSGTVAFDEFHQGYGSEQNRLLSYFSGTPVVPVFLQLTLLLGLVMLSRGRRFARPLPLAEPSRLSKLEYVSAMAQLKKRTKAYDLAMENIYTDFRRRVSRLVGVDNHHTQNAELAAAISARTGDNIERLIQMMQACEDIVHGVKTSKKEVLELATQIREIERSLGLRRSRNLFR